MWANILNSTRGIIDRVPVSAFIYDLLCDKLELPEGAYYIQPVQRGVKPIKIDALHDAGDPWYRVQKNRIGRWYSVNRSGDVPREDYGGDVYILWDGVGYKAIDISTYMTANTMLYEVLDCKEFKEQPLNMRYIPEGIGVYYTDECKDGPETARIIAKSGKVKDVRGSIIFGYIVGDVIAPLSAYGVSSLIAFSPVDEAGRLILAVDDIIETDKDIKLVKIGSDTVEDIGI